MAGATAILVFLISPDVGVPSRGVTNVGEVANTIAPVPVTDEIPLYSTSHEAAVVPVIRIQVNTHSELATIATIALPPDELTVTTPEDLLTILKSCPKVNVLVTGIVTVWVVEPVKN